MNVELTYKEVWATLNAVSVKSESKKRVALLIYHGLMRGAL